MSKSDVCPVCGEGSLTPQVEMIAAEHREVSREIESHYSVCDGCGSEQAGPLELRANKRTMVAFKKQVDGLLTGAQVRALRERLGVNQSEAAKIFGGGPVAFSKYESDDVSQSEAMDKLLRLADELPEAFAVLAFKADVSSVKPDGLWVTVDSAANLGRVITRKKRSKLHVVSSSVHEEPRKYA
ncbi:HTH-type transcriptional regulator / antitoxin MqsA [Marinobacter sp. LV10R510-11A]|uniref:type II toxin-antitoxin system MqsA family antitoxin n=1 Tax=Marinobacter sp. LV10R510-11A TaxID=1415568 RepID=UPI000BB85E7B|nr:type II toxin-antitoxin system MqsA family antitoxin [Marinobacter sp. LV10R510-11A]SOB74575.1 HTH-type transcriptional regulator / antitoxin MqsA [Marinobacter sp. LV10R510-11A]